MPVDITCSPTLRNVIPGNSWCVSGVDKAIKITSTASNEAATMTEAGLSIAPVLDTAVTVGEDAGPGTVAAGATTGDILFLAEGSVTTSAGGGITIAVNGSVEPDGGSVAIQGGALGGVIVTLDPVAGPTIELMPGVLTLRVGPPGAGTSITMTPASIIFQVGPTTYAMTPVSIAETVLEATRAVTADGHLLTSGGTTMNVGVQGVAVLAPTCVEEFEGGVEVNAAVAEVSIDGPRSEQVGMEMVQ